MTPTQLQNALKKIVRHGLKRSVMVWGPPGIGKSSIVSQVARDAGIGCIDLRLSQLAPTDLRGLPVAEEGLSRWFPPEFLPRDGRGTLGPMARPMSDAPVARGGTGCFRPWKYGGMIEFAKHTRTI